MFTKAGNDQGLETNSSKFFWDMIALWCNHFIVYMMSLNSLVVPKQFSLVYVILSLDTYN